MAGRPTTLQGHCTVPAAAVWAASRSPARLRSGGTRSRVRSAGDPRDAPLPGCVPARHVDAREHGPLLSLTDRRRRYVGLALVGYGLAGLLVLAGAGVVVGGAIDQLIVVGGRGAGQRGAPVGTPPPPPPTRA